MIGTSGMKRGVAVMLAFAALVSVAACTRESDSTRSSASSTVSGDTWLATDAISPSGQFRVLIAVEENWMAAVSIVQTASGNTVFDVGSYSRSRNHAFGVGWLSTEPEQLWVYSGDVACAKAEMGPQGNWVKSNVGAKDLPAEVKRWG